jgi:hypothetical protein
MSLFSKKPSADIPRRRQANPGDERRERQAARDVQQNSTFRRNRTLTGSLSSSVSSATEATGDLQSTRTQAHHLARHRRRLSGVLGVILVAIVILSALLFDLTVQPVIVSSDHTVQLDDARYQNAIKDYFAAHPFERLRIALDRQRLADYLHKVTPEVASIDPEGFAGISKSEFSIAVRQPIAGWLIGDKQYFVDENGVPFEKNYYAVPQVSVVDQSGVQQAAGTAIASARFLAFVGRTVSFSAKQGMVVKQAIIPQGTTRELEVQIENHSYPIKLSLDRPVGEQVEDMKRAIAYFDAKKQSPQYIDVRVSGRAYYR